MVRIRRFGIVRTATTVAALYAVIALVFVVLFGLIALAGVAVRPRQLPDGDRGRRRRGRDPVRGLRRVLFYAVIGWIFTAIACALYNFVAGLRRGIEIQVESTTPGAPGGGYPAYGYPTYGGAGGHTRPRPVPGAGPARVARPRPGAAARSRRRPPGTAAVKRSNLEWAGESHPRQRAREASPHAPCGARGTGDLARPRRGSRPTAREGGRSRPPRSPSGCASCPRSPSSPPPGRRSIPRPSPPPSRPAGPRAPTRSSRTSTPSRRAPSPRPRARC